MKRIITLILLGCITLPASAREAQESERKKSILERRQEKARENQAQQWSAPEVFKKENNLKEEEEELETEREAKLPSP